LERYKHFSHLKQLIVELMAEDHSQGLATKTATPAETKKATPKDGFLHLISQD